jgi:hypothetical protein
MNKNLKYLLGTLLLMVFVTFTSCDEVEDADIGGTSVEQMSGDWWVIALEDDGESPAYNGDYVQFTTYNTAANDGGLWLDDHGNWMEIKSKVSANVSSLTFAGEPNSPELYTEGTVTVSNGLITKASYETASKTMVDEIYFEAEFDWDPGYTYKFKGHKRTGFPEDENPHYSH